MNDPSDRSLDRWLSEVRSEYWASLGGEQAKGQAVGDLFVVFQLAGMRFATDARLCKGVVRKPRLTRLPGVPPHVLGVAGIRGEVVSVTDPLVLLGVPGRRPETRGHLLILAWEVVKAALWVDRVNDVVPLGDPLLALDAPWPGAPEDVLTGQATVEQGSVFVLDGRRYLEVSGTRAPATRP